MPNERLDSPSRGMSSPPESPLAPQADESREQRNRESPERGGALRDTPDSPSTEEEAGSAALQASPPEGQSYWDLMYKDVAEDRVAG